MGTLAFERGASTLGQNLMFLNEWDEVLARGPAQRRASTTPSIRQRLVDTWIRLRLMRLNAMRIMSSTHEAPPAAMVTKLFWATLHRDLGELAMDVLGAEATLRTGDGRRLTQPPPAPLPLQPQRHDLRRHQPDPAQHHRRARPRPPQGAHMTELCASPPQSPTGAQRPQTGGRR